MKIEHDVLDVPRDRFLIAGDAWVQCRAGKADASFAELRTLYEGDDRLRVPATVFNAVLNHPEAI